MWNAPCAWLPAPFDTAKLMSEFAPEYTKRERVALLLKHGSWILPLVVFTQFFLIPWIADYALLAQCYSYGNFTRADIILYGCFVVLPLLFALTLWLIEGQRSLNIIRLGQSPLPGEKVFRRTRYTFGWRAKIKAYLLLAVVIFLLLLAVKGIFSVKAFVFNPAAMDCAKAAPVSQSKS